MIDATATEPAAATADDSHSRRSRTKRGLGVGPARRGPAACPPPHRAADRETTKTGLGVGPARRGRLPRRLLVWRIEKQRKRTWRRSGAARPPAPPPPRLADRETAKAGLGVRPARHGRLRRRLLVWRIENNETGLGVGPARHGRLRAASSFFADRETRKPDLASVRRGTAHRWRIEKREPAIAAPPCTIAAGGSS
jgi:hypothetical protein